MIYYSASNRFFGTNAAFLCCVTMIMLYGCGNTIDKTATPTITEAAETKQKVPAREVPATKVVRSTDSLLYQSPTFMSYVDGTKRGAGIVSFTLNVQDRLDILNMDNTKFGEIVLNQDLTYFTLNMPKKIIARKVIPEYDFAAFDFDVEKLETDKEYLIIYVNKEKRKVKKSELKFTFAPW